jgi:hypothetical protein
MGFKTGDIIFADLGSGTVEIRRATDDEGGREKLGTFNFYDGPPAEYTKDWENALETNKGNTWYRKIKEAADTANDEAKEAMYRRQAEADDIAARQAARQAAEADRRSEKAEGVKVYRDNAAKSVGTKEPVTPGNLQPGQEVPNTHKPSVSPKTDDATKRGLEVQKRGNTGTAPANTKTDTTAVEPTKKPATPGNLQPGQEVPKLPEPPVQAVEPLGGLSSFDKSQKGYGGPKITFKKLSGTIYRVFEDGEPKTTVNVYNMPTRYKAAFEEYRKTEGTKPGETKPADIKTDEERKAEDARVLATEEAKEEINRRQAEARKAEDARVLATEEAKEEINRRQAKSPEDTVVKPPPPEDTVIPTGTKGFVTSGKGSQITKAEQMRQIYAHVKDGKPDDWLLKHKYELDLFNKYNEDVTPKEEGGGGGKYPENPVIPGHIKDIPEPGEGGIRKPEDIDNLVGGGARTVEDYDSAKKSEANNAELTDLNTRAQELLKEFNAIRSDDTRSGQKKAELLKAEYFALARQAKALGRKLDVSTNDFLYSDSRLKMIKPSAGILNGVQTKY